MVSWIRSAPARPAMQLAQQGDSAFLTIMAPTGRLSRWIFLMLPRHYKTRLVFLAWLNGFQEHFVMLAGAQAMRPLPYFCQVFRFADQSGVLRDPDLAIARMRRLLAIYGVADA